MSSPPRRPARLSLVIYAKNKRRVSAFYQAVAGLAVVEGEASFDLLSGPAGEVVVHAIPKIVAASSTITKPPALREETAIKPVIPVADLETTRAAAHKAGGGLLGTEASWAWRGRLHLAGWDPEGNVVQFTQALPRPRRAGPA